MPCRLLKSKYKMIDSITIKVAKCTNFNVSHSICFRNLIIRYCGDAFPEPHADSTTRSTYVTSPGTSRIPDMHLPVPLPTGSAGQPPQRGFMPWFVRRFLLTSTQRQNGTSSTFFMMKEPLSSNSSMPATPKMYNSPTFGGDEGSAHPTLSTNAMMKFPPKAHTHDPYTTFHDIEDDQDDKEPWVELQPTGSQVTSRKLQRKEERQIIGGL